VDKIKEEVDIVELISSYVQLKKTGINYVGLCPFHSEKTPSFTVSPNKKLYHCFGCGEGGDVIGFIMKKENLDFIGAVKFIADKYNIDIDLKERNVDNSLKNRIFDINKLSCEYYHKNLFTNKIALEYLSKRKINAKIAKEFHIGYANDSWDGLVDFLKKHGITEEEIVRAGLASRKKNGNGYVDRFRNRIIFPIYDIKSRVIGFGGRVLDDSLPKYLNSPDTLVFSKGNHLYGLNNYLKSSNQERIILVEGYMDVISLYRSGITCAVASLGTALTINQAKLLKQYNSNIYVCYDSDEAGQRASLKAIDILTRTGVEPKVIILPNGNDPDDFIKENGINGFEKVIEKALSYIEFKVYTMERKFDLTKESQKIDFIREMAEILSGIKSPVAREIYLQKYSNKYNVSKEAILKEMGINISKEIKPIKKMTQENKISHPKAELEAISLILLDNEESKKLIERLEDEYFQDFYCRLCFSTIKKRMIEGKEISPQAILEDLIDYSEFRPQIDNILFRELEYDLNNLNEFISDIIKNLELNMITSQRDNLITKIKKLENDEKYKEEVIKLTMEVAKLNKKIALINTSGEEVSWTKN
ncbi:MAG TPA: DNA primase, partial [Soehngenia sp.]|nr:DNA primase [Soehngenia sp.]